jgi:hypothetical protein
LCEISLVAHTAFYRIAPEMRARLPSPRTRKWRAACDAVGSVRVRIARASPPFRALLERLETTDVVCMRSAPPPVDGELTLIGAVADGVTCWCGLLGDLTVPRKIAILGHEPQHARRPSGRP